MGTIDEWRRNSAAMLSYIARIIVMTGQNRALMSRRAHERREAEKQGERGIRGRAGGGGVGGCSEGGGRGTPQEERKPQLSGLVR